MADAPAEAPAPLPEASVVAHDESGVALVATDAATGAHEELGEHMEVEAAPEIWEGASGYPVCLQVPWGALAMLEAEIARYVGAARYLLRWVQAAEGFLTSDAVLAVYPEGQPHCSTAPTTALGVVEAFRRLEPLLSDGSGEHTGYAASTSFVKIVTRYGEGDLATAMQQQRQAMSAHAANCYASVSGVAPSGEGNKIALIYHALENAFLAYVEGPDELARHWFLRAGLYHAANQACGVSALSNVRHALLAYSSLVDTIEAARPLELYSGLRLVSGLMMAHNSDHGSDHRGALPRYSSCQGLYGKRVRTALPLCSRDETVVVDPGYAHTLAAFICSTDQPSVAQVEEVLQPLYDAWRRACVSPTTFEADVAWPLAGMMTSLEPAVWHEPISNRSDRRVRPVNGGARETLFGFEGQPRSAFSVDGLVQDDLLRAGDQLVEALYAAIRARAREEFVRLLLTADASLIEAATAALLDDLPLDASFVFLLNRLSDTLSSSTLAWHDARATALRRVDRLLRGDAVADALDVPRFAGSHGFASDGSAASSDLRLICDDASAAGTVGALEVPRFVGGSAAANPQCRSYARVTTDFTREPSAWRPPCCARLSLSFRAGENPVGCAITVALRAPNAVVSGPARLDMCSAIRPFNCSAYQEEEAVWEMRLHCTPAQRAYGERPGALGYVLYEPPEADTWQPAPAAPWRLFVVEIVVVVTAPAQLGFAVVPDDQQPPFYGGSGELSAACVVDAQVGTQLARCEFCESPPRGYVWVFCASTFSFEVLIQLGCDDTFGGSLLPRVGLLPTPCLALRRDATSVCDVPAGALRPQAQVQLRRDFVGFVHTAEDETCLERRNQKRRRLMRESLAVDLHSGAFVIGLRGHRLDAGLDVACAAESPLARIDHTGIGALLGSRSLHPGESRATSPSYAPSSPSYAP